MGECGISTFALSVAHPRDGSSMQKDSLSCILQKKKREEKKPSKLCQEDFSYKYLYISLWEVHCIISGLLHKYMNK